MPICCTSAMNKLNKATNSCIKYLIPFCLFIWDVVNLRLKSLFWYDYRPIWYHVITEERGMVNLELILFRTSSENSGGSLCLLTESFLYPLFYYPPLTYTLLVPQNLNNSSNISNIYRRRLPLGIGWVVSLSIIVW